MSRFSRRSGLGAMAVGTILVLVGGYYVLRNTFGLPLDDIDSETVWPVIVLVLGLVVMIGAINRRRDEPNPPNP